MTPKHTPPHRETVPVEQRQHYILELLEKEEITTQEYLVRKIFRKFGQSISPATVSRDLKKLGVVKTPRGLTLASEASLTLRQERLARTFEEFDVSVLSDATVLAITTSSGSARSVAVKIAHTFPEAVVGSVTSDELALIVAKNPAARKELATTLCDLATLSQKK